MTEKINRTGLLEREHALDRYFQTLLIKGLQDFEPREHKSSAEELSEIDSEDRSDDIPKQNSSN